jgi:hypothetical protein
MESLKIRKRFVIDTCKLSCFYFNIIVVGMYRYKYTGVVFYLGQINFFDVTSERRYNTLQ